LKNRKPISIFLIINMFDKKLSNRRINKSSN